MSDASYKSLLSNAWFVRQFIVAFIDAEMVSKLDLDSLTQYPTESLGLHDQNLPPSSGRRRKKQRLNDIMWKLGYVDEDELYLLFMIEAQSTVDSKMTLRIGEYVLNWYSHIIDSGGRKQVLPLIMPLVIYNESMPWRAPTKLRDMVAIPEGFKISRPLVDVEYFVIDGERVIESMQLPEGNVFAPLLRSMHARQIEEFRENLLTTSELVRAAGQTDAYLKAVTTFVLDWKSVRNTGWFESSEYQEVDEMSSIGFPEWEREFHAKGRAEGLEQGLEQVAERMLERGWPAKEIADCTGLSLSQVRNLRNANNSGLGL